MVALVAGLHVTLGTASSEDNRSGPPMTYAAFPTTQMMTPPGMAPHQAPPTVNATAAAPSAMPVIGQQQQWTQVSTATAPQNFTPASGYVNVCGACGSGHEPAVACRALSVHCFSRNQVGHFARCCPNRGSQGAPY